MKGYVARKGDRWYAVIYEGLDPVTGREQRSWHPARTDRAEAEALARQLATQVNGRDDEGRTLSFGAYLTTRWLPGKRLTLRATTWDGYRRRIDRHILPALGRIPIRRLRPAHLEALYESLLNPTDGRRALAPKSVLDVHLIIRGALAHAERQGLVSRNVAVVAHAPRLRSIPEVETQPWTASQLQAFLRAAAGHRLFPAFWLLAATGMRRNEVLGLRWADVDFERRSASWRAQAEFGFGRCGVTTTTAGSWCQAMATTREATLARVSGRSRPGWRDVVPMLPWARTRNRAPLAATTSASTGHAWRWWAPRTTVAPADSR
jgi:hypothetical protein